MTGTSDKMEQAYRMLDDPLIQAIRAHGVNATLAALCTHLGQMLHKIGSHGLVSPDMALDAVRQIAEKGEGSVRFMELRGSGHG